MSTNTNFASMIEDALKEMAVDFITAEDEVLEAQEDDGTGTEAAGDFMEEEQPAQFILPMAIDDENIIPVNLVVHEKGYAELDAVLFSEVPEEQDEDALQACNQLNDTWAFCAFRLDPEGQIHMGLDFFLVPDPKDTAWLLNMNLNTFIETGPEAIADLQQALNPDQNMMA